MKKLFKKSVSGISLVIILALTVCFCGTFLTACKNDTEEDKVTVTVPVYNTTGMAQNAAIILPGVLASNLINAKTGETLWSVGSLISNIAMNENMLDDEGRFNTDALSSYLYSFLKYADDGTTELTVRPANMNDADLEYGFLSYYKSLYDTTVASCPGYTVKLFQYDWRKSCTDSARDLADFIAANKYENVILIGHSMGGLVIDHYLALSDANRDNTKAVITLSTPHLGAVDAACVNLGGVAPTLFSSVSDASFSAMMNELNGKLPSGCNSVTEFALTLFGILQTAARTLPCTYDMIPNTSLFGTETYVSSNIYTINGNVVGYDELYRDLQNASFATGNAKTAIDNLSDAHKALYVNGVFVANLVDTYYFAGNGVATTSTLKLSYNNNAFAFAGYSSTDAGDMLVLVDSSIAGNPRNAANVFIFDDTNHLNIATTADSSTKETTAVGKKLSTLLKSLAV